MGGYFRSERRAASIAAAEIRLRELYGDVRLDGLGAYTERAIGDGRFTLSEVVLDGDFRATADVRTVTVSFSTPGYRWRSGGDEGDLSTSPALLQPGQVMHSRLAGRPRVTSVTFDTHSLASVARAVRGHDVAVRFEGARPAHRDLGTAWMRTVRTMESARLIQNDLSRTIAFEALAMMVLDVFRLGGAPHTGVTTAAGAREAHRRAAAFLDERLAALIGEVDVARAAGVSVEELRVVFAAQSAAGWTPVEHLRRGRLAAAHLELREGDPDAGDTVTAIAARWGFTTPSRFAGLHREVFGTTPSAVLAGPRGRR